MFWPFLGLGGRSGEALLRGAGRRWRRGLTRDDTSRGKALPRDGWLLVAPPCLATAAAGPAAMPRHGRLVARTGASSCDQPPRGTALPRSRPPCHRRPVAWQALPTKERRPLGEALPTAAGRLAKPCQATGGPWQSLGIVAGTHPGTSGSVWVFLGPVPVVASAPAAATRDRLFDWHVSRFCCAVTAADRGLLVAVHTCTADLRRALRSQNPLRNASKYTHAPVEHEGWHMPLWSTRGGPQGVVRTAGSPPEIHRRSRRRVTTPRGLPEICGDPTLGTKSRLRRDRGAPGRGPLEHPDRSGGHAAARRPQAAT